MICANLMLHGICYWSKNSWTLSNEAFCKPDVTGKKKISKYEYMHTTGGRGQVSWS